MTILRDSSVLISMVIMIVIMVMLIEMRYRIPFPSSQMAHSSGSGVVATYFQNAASHNDVPKANTSETMAAAISMVM